METADMRVVPVLLAAALLVAGCSHKALTVSGLIGLEKIEVTYLLKDGRWVDADSLKWSDRTWYRELRFDTDGDGEWNYLYGEVYDDLGGWTWIPSSVRVNPKEEPELARQRKYLVAERAAPPAAPGLDDFGYERRK
jgi:hypothetical protein